MAFLHGLGHEFTTLVFVLYYSFVFSILCRSKNLVYTHRTGWVWDYCIWNIDVRMRIIFSCSLTRSLARSGVYVSASNTGTVCDDKRESRSIRYLRPSVESKDREGESERELDAMSPFVSSSSSSNRYDTASADT